MLWMLHFFCVITLFLVVVGSKMIFYYFILTYKKLTPQKIWNIVSIFCVNILLYCEALQVEQTKNNVTKLL